MQDLAIKRNYAHLVKDNRVRYFLPEALRSGEVAIRGVILDDGRPHNLSPESLERQVLLLRHVLWHYDDAAIALHCRRECNANSCNINCLMSSKINIVMITHQNFPRLAL